MANPLVKKLGPLETWQWLALGGGGGLLLYLYERNKKPSEETPTSELAGSTNNPLTEGSGTGGGAEGNSPTPAPGPIGEPGPAGVPGTPAEIPAGLSEARINALEGEVERLNNPPVGSHTVAPQAKANPYPLVNPANGQHYKIVHEKGKVVHQYANGHKVVIGKKSKTKAGHTAPVSHARPKPLKVKAKRPAPKPQRKPVHHAAAPAKKPAKKKAKR